MDMASRKIPAQRSAGGDRVVHRLNARRKASAGRSGLTHSAVPGPVLAAVVIVIALAIVLLPGDPSTLHILRMVQVRPFLPRDHAVSLGPGLHVFDALLAGFQATGFSRGQGTGLDALLDTGFLSGLPLVHPRRGWLGKRKQRQHETDGGYERLGRHVVLLVTLKGGTVS